MTDEIPPRYAVQKPAGEYTRWKAKLKIGDGPDCRAEVTIEMSRKAGKEEQGFADWYVEMERALAACRSQLGLTAPDSTPGPASEEADA